jgi:hypothetical protein
VLHSTPLTVKAAKKLYNEGPENPQVREAFLQAVASRPLVVASPANEVMVLKPVASDKQALGIHPQTAERLQLRFNGDKLRLFLPLSEEALAEARDEGKRIPLDSGSSLAALTLDDIVELAWTRTPIALSPLDRMALGIRPVASWASTTSQLSTAEAS